MTLSARDERRARLAFEAACLGLVLLVAFPLLLGRSYWAGDVLPQLLPFRAALQSALEQGEFYVWNPELYSGYLALGGGQSGTYYPVNWLLYGVLPLQAAFKASYLLHFWLLARGAAGLSRALGACRRGALVTAAAALLGSVVAGHTQHANVVVGLAWTPVLLWLALGVLRAERPLRPILALAAAFALALFEAQPQYVWIAGLGSLTLAAAARARPGQVARIAGAGVLGLILAAPLLLPLLEYQDLFPRPQPEGRYAFVTTGALELRDLPGWILGSPGYRDLEGNADLPFVSLTFLGLALLGATRPRSSEGRPLVVRWALLLLGGGLGLSLAWPYLVLAHVPPFSLFRIPQRFAWWVQLGLALLAGRAWSSAWSRGWSEGGRAPSRRALLGAFVLCLVATIGALASGERELLRPLGLVMALGGLVALAFGLGALGGLTLPRRRAALLGALACGLLELALTWPSNAPTLPDGELLAPPAAAERIAASGNPRALDLATPRTMDLAARERLRRNTGSLWGVHYVCGYEASPPLVQESLLAELEHQAVTDPRGLRERCERLSVRWVLTPSLPIEAGFVPRGEAGSISLYEVPAARPPAYALSPQGKVRPLRTEARGSSEWSLPVELPEPSLVVLTQAYYPGWSATVDGEQVPLAPAVEGLFLGVEVPPGAHEVGFHFDNPSVFLGQRLGLAAWLIAALVLALAAARAREGQES